MTLAMVFPGQGSQSIGMFAAYGQSPVVRETIALASDILQQDLAKLVAQGPVEALSKTVNTQPVMVTVGVAAYRLWRSLGGPVPAVMAGHSLGEYTALVAAGALRLEDCLPLVRFRAQAMQEAVPQGTGAMAAILGLDDDAIRAACDESAQGEVVEPVNFNAPSQVVIAGHAAAVARAGDACKARGAKRVIALPVSAPFHSSLLAPAAVRLAARLEQIPLASPTVPVIHNFDVAEHPQSAAIRAALSAQADHPVRWSESVLAMANRGVTRIAECGPGKVLAQLVKRIDARLTGVALNDIMAIEAELAQVRQQMDIRHE